ncbi:MAG: ATP-dependent Clp protease proteolytic subunit [Candidatus Brocadiae bacterium]|nr:ATP-dependent Clp protease proteolytic subunit [Candidatus Brocadiia bacterium]
MPYEIPMPSVIEQTGHGERSWDVFSRLLKDRIIFLGYPINDMVANLVIGQMLFLQMENKKQDISIYINSPGGDITAGLAIYDTMQFVQCDVATYCIGQASSMGAVLLAAGTPGKRYALPHARLMLHQPWGGARGSAKDILIHAEEILRLKQSIANIIAYHTKKTPDQIVKDSDRDFYMSAEEAKNYGLVDEVVGSLKEIGMKNSTPKE